MKNIVVLLATYNGSQYLREQLDSIFAQTFQDLEWWFMTMSPLMKLQLL